jgi:hypothetical protein
MEDVREVRSRVGSAVRSQWPAGFDSPVFRQMSRLTRRRQLIPVPKGVLRLIACG